MQHRYRPPSQACVRGRFFPVVKQRRPSLRLLSRGVLLLVAQVALCGSVHAERLPVRQYTIADGLASGSVRRICQDKRGFLWLATNDGLSRFDGYQFTNYGVRDGLGRANLNDVVTDHRGRLWVATGGSGVSLLLDEKAAAQQGKKFSSFLLGPARDAFETNTVHRIIFDADNRMWCLTDAGLYRSKSSEIAAEQFERVSEPFPADTAHLSLDRQGNVWAAAKDILIRVTGGVVTSYQLWQEAGETKGYLNTRWIIGGVELADGRFLIATQKDIYEFTQPAQAKQRGAWRRLPLSLTPQQVIGAIHATSDGGLWIGTQQGLIRYRDGQQITYRIGNTPNPFNILTLFTERDGNLLIGTVQTGLLKLAGEAVAIYDASDGLQPVVDIYFLDATHDGRMVMHGRPVAVTACDETFIAGEKFIHFQPPPGFCVHGIKQDKRKNWWVLRWLPEKKTYRVLFIPGPQLDLHLGYELTVADGWVDGLYAEVFEDSEGNIWFRRQIDWFKKTGNVYRVEFTDSGRPRLHEVVNNVVASYMLRDRSGTLWMSEGYIFWRLRNGKKDTIEPGINSQQSWARGFYQDSKHRLWIYTQGQGVFMTEQPEAEQPRFTNYNVAHGLPSNYVAGMCEDDAGRLYLGTGRGLCVWDVTTGRSSIISFGDHAIGSAVRDLQKDQRGNIWASVVGAVVRVNPQLLPRVSNPLSVYFSQINIAGETLALGATGTTTLALPELSSARNNISIRFLSPNLRSENSVLYQYQLAGADNEWSAPSLQREVNFANLAPGRYQFKVRVLDDEGRLSPTEASLQFTILRPLWQRWWFVLLAALGIGLTALAFYRSRLKRVIELERVRTRIATDLHDDIGSSLTQIAILSEVSRQRVNGNENGLGDALAQIANTSRDLVDSMGDIVWAINPKRDRLRDLSQRMREFTSEVFTTRDIEFRFQGSAQNDDIKLDADVRRQLYLICKEAVNNVARHAQCSAAEVLFAVNDGHLVLVVQDNGQGLAGNGSRPHSGRGNGLDSMRARASALGGKFEITSQPQQGTTVKLTLPLDGRKRARWKKYLPV